MIKIKTIKHLLLWIFSTLIVCLMFLGIKQFIGVEFLYGLSIYWSAYHLVSSIVKIIEEWKK